MSRCRRSSPGSHDGARRGLVTSRARTRRSCECRPRPPAGSSARSFRSGGCGGNRRRRGRSWSPRGRSSGGNVRARRTDRNVPGRLLMMVSERVFSWSAPVLGRLPIRDILEENRDPFLRGVTAGLQPDAAFLIEPLGLQRLLPGAPLPGTSGSSGALRLYGKNIEHPLAEQICIGSEARATRPPCC